MVESAFDSIVEVARPLAWSADADAAAAPFDTFTRPSRLVSTTADVDAGSASSSDRGFEAGAFCDGEVAGDEDGAGARAEEAADSPLDGFSRLAEVIAAEPGI